MNSHILSYPLQSKRSWLRCKPGNAPPLSGIHVWRTALDLPVNQVATLFDSLSADEQERASRFHFEKDKYRFITARATLREILSGYLKSPPGEIHFEYTAFGKPFLREQETGTGIRFNLSHAGGQALYAITAGRDTGIDLEPLRNDLPMEKIGDRFFSAMEMATLRQTPEELRAGLFFQYWARKEALLKAIGRGLSFPAELCDVTPVTGDQPKQIHLSAEDPGLQDWFVCDLFPGAALAARGGDWPVTCYEYDRSGI